MDKNEDYVKLTLRDMRSTTLKKTSVSVFEFTNYRAYLKAVYDDYKSTKTQFSYRYFARIAGFGGQSYLRMVMDGQRSLTPESITKFARGLKLSRQETNYFEALVFYNQARSEEESDRYFAQMMALKPKTKMEGLTKDQFEYITDNLYVIIREMAALKDFKNDPSWIAKNLYHHIKPSQIAKALEVLQRLELLTQTKEGNLKHSGKTLQSPLDVESLDILNYHRNIISHSKDAITTSPPDEWDISSVTLPTSKKNLPAVMTILRRAIQEIVDVVNSNPQDRDEVYQINYQLFPVTRVTRDKE